jgi:hypothetical protein
MPLRPRVASLSRQLLASWLFAQPDVQSVVNPSAGIPTTQGAVPLKNALVFGLRPTTAARMKPDRFAN